MTTPAGEPSLSGAGREKGLGSYMPVPQTDKGEEVKRERGAGQQRRGCKGKEEGTEKEE